MRTTPSGRLRQDKLCELLLAAQMFRRRFFKDDERFDPVRMIEHSLPILYPTLVVDIVDELEIDGFPAEAGVTFDEGILLRITEQTYVSAVNCIDDQLFTMRTLYDAPSVFTLTHEIAHILLHSRKFRNKAKSLARGVAGKGTSFRSNAREEREANIFAGGLLIPIDMVTAESDPKMLAIKYRVSRYVAQRIITQRQQILES